MPQDRESGAKANIYGRETARKIMAKLGTQPIDGNTNECYMEDRLVAIKCAHMATNDIGVSYRMLKRIEAVIGAFEVAPHMYELYEISTKFFGANMRPTRSKGPAAGKVGLVRKAIVIDKGKALGTVKLTGKPT